MNKPQRYDVICRFCNQLFTILTEEVNNRAILCPTCHKINGVVHNHVYRTSRWAIDLFLKGLLNNG